MNKEQQRIKIAEACGWTDFNNAKHEGAIQYGRKPLSCSDSWIVPDYLNDLNAMHIAEMILTRIQRLFYQVNLIKLQKADLVAGSWDLIHATAAQRAEAFLRTLNLWEE
jgi:hypothetical protein